jgi:hypothetical protein
LNAPALVCGNCRDPMQRLTLPGHYGQAVEIDLCAGCHLVWFDLTESARMTGPALLELIGRMADAQSLPHRVLRREAGCARCRGPLKTVHNQSRWGRSLQLECANRHGAYQTFAQFLQEKGLLRPMSSADRARALQRHGHIDCVNCGSAIGADQSQCPHCASVPSVLDIARLAQALDPEGAIADQASAQAVQATPVRQGAMQCPACGAALPPGQAMQCSHCGATLAVNRLAEAHASVQVLAPALRAHAEKPAPHVVERRLQALQADLPRQRAWAKEMEAEARSGQGSDADWTGGLFSSGTNPMRAVLLALVIWLVWRFWG